MERLPLPSLLIPLPQAVFPRLRLCSDSHWHCFSSSLPPLLSLLSRCLCFSCTLCLSLGLFLPLAGSLSGFLTLSSSVFVSLPHPRHSLSNLVLIFSPSPCPSHSFRPASTTSGDILGPGPLLPAGLPARPQGVQTLSASPSAARDIFLPPTSPATSASLPVTGARPGKVHSEG